MHQNNRIIMWLRHEYGEGNDNVKTVIEALEKQIPKKVVVGVRRKCPSCGEMFASDWKFCFECGQKLDWGEEE